MDGLALNTKQGNVIWLGTAALVILCLFPPWHHVVNAKFQNSIRPYHEFGFYFLFDTHQKEPSIWIEFMTFSIAWGQLLLLALVVVAITGFVVATLKKR